MADGGGWRRVFQNFKFSFLTKNYVLTIFGFLKFEILIFDFEFSSQSHFQPHSFSTKHFHSLGELGRASWIQH